MATNLDSGEEVWLRQGRMFDAIRASMATPLVFTPFGHGERKLLYGALVNPLPVAATCGNRTDLTIAVNLSGRVDPLRQASASATQHDRHHRRIGKLIDGLRPAGSGGQTERGMLEMAFMSMQTMHDTIS